MIFWLRKKTPVPFSVRDTTRTATGTRSLRGAVDGPKEACTLEVPFASRAGRSILISFRVRGDRPRAVAGLRRGFSGADR